jgi:hypothetical protein
MNLNKIIEEIYDGGYSNQYPAYSEGPRKDFAPMSSRGGYTNPYQRGGDNLGVLSRTENDTSPSMPWPLQTLEQDISDSVVFLLQGISKMSSCLKTNPVMQEDDEMKDELIKIFKASKHACKILAEVGKRVNRLNLAKPQPLQNPLNVSNQQNIDPNSIPNINPTIAIKLP